MLPYIIFYCKILCFKNFYPLKPEICLIFILRPSYSVQFQTFTTRNTYRFSKSFLRKRHTKHKDLILFGYSVKDHYYVQCDLEKG